MHMTVVQVDSASQVADVVSTGNTLREALNYLCRKSANTKVTAIKATARGIVG
jgi:hypothetical protein